MPLPPYLQESQNNHFATDFTPSKTMILYPHGMTIILFLPLRLDKGRFGRR